MVAEPPHSPGFAADADSGGVIQFLGLDEGKGHITVKEGIVGQIDLLLAPFPEEFLYSVATVDE
jgi:hypothetical protein